MSSASRIGNQRVTKIDSRVKPKKVLKSEPSPNPNMKLVFVGGGIIGLLSIVTVAALIFAFSATKKQNPVATNSVAPAVIASAANQQPVQTPQPPEQPAIQLVAAIQPTQATKPVETPVEQPVQAVVPVQPAPQKVEVAKPKETVTAEAPTEQPQPEAKPQPQPQASRPQPKEQLNSAQQKKLMDEYAGAKNTISRSPALIEEGERYLAEQEARLEKLLKNRNSYASDKTTTRNLIRTAKERLESVKSNFESAKTKLPVLKTRLRNAGLLTEDEE